MPLSPVFGLKGHSLVFETGTTIPGEAVFLEYQERSGAVLTPELFPRTDGTTYVCAISSEEPLPIDPARVAPVPSALIQTSGTEQRSSLARMASADLVQTNGLGLALCSAR
jgi:hypothetical protein